MVAALLSTSLPPYHPIDNPGFIIGNIHDASGLHDDINGPAKRTIRRKPAGNKIFHSLKIPLRIKPIANDLIARRFAPVPGTMIRDQQVKPVLFRPALFRNKSKTKRGGVCGNINMAWGLCGAERGYPAKGINLIFPVTERPPVIFSLSNDIYLVGRQ